MQETLSNLKQTLASAAERLRAARLPGELTLQLDDLVTQVDQPCVVAVVGRVKAGKSTFVNALLGEDLAKVGVTETTATINYFTYGRSNPERPVRCHWRGGRITEETREFLDALQGNDEETLHRSQGIEHLEYRLLNPYLQKMTLVDTPGMAAIVDAHQDRLAEFMGLRGQLRERNEQESARIGSEADAVIYVIGQVARTTDQAFLEEFSQVTNQRSRASCAVGVMTKIDLQPEIMARSQELAAKVSHQLKDNLNTVVPVSAGIQRAFDMLLEDNGTRLDALCDQLSRVPASRLTMLLDSEEFYREFEFSDCPISPPEREILLGNMPWTVFTTIARTVIAGGGDSRAVADRLLDAAGFARLRKIIEQRFIERGQLLRCYRIVNDARTILNAIRYKHLPVLRQQDTENKAKIARLLNFVRHAGGDAQTRRELEEFVAIHGNLAGHAERIEMIVQDLDRQLSGCSHDFEEANTDIDALQCLDEHLDQFSPAEIEELRPLFGLYGLELAARLSQGNANVGYVEQRSLAWNAVYRQAKALPRRAIAASAMERYGRIFDTICDDPLLQQYDDSSRHI